MYIIPKSWKAGRGKTSRGHMEKSIPPKAYSQSKKNQKIMEDKTVSERGGCFRG